MAAGTAAYRQRFASCRARGDGRFPVHRLPRPSRDPVSGRTGGLPLARGFGFAYDEIAGVVRKTEGNCRQIAARVRRHVEAGRPRFEVSREQKEQLATRFFAAVGEGDLDGLMELLAVDVVIVGDGGGKAPAIRHPLHGRERVARLLADLGRWARPGEVQIRTAEINGQPGAIVSDRSGRLVSVFSLDIVDGHVQAIRGVLNPDKLRHLGDVADIGRLVREGRERDS